MEKEREIIAAREREHSVMLQVDEGGGDGKDNAKKVEIVEGEERQVEVKTRSKRVAALDAFRGLTIVVCHLLCLLFSLFDLGVWFEGLVWLSVDDISR